MTTRKNMIDAFKIDNYIVTLEPNTRTSRESGKPEKTRNT